MTIFLSEQLGLPVVTQDGHRLGRVADLSVQLGLEEPPVHRVFVKAGRRRAHLLTWADVIDVTPGQLVVRAPADAVEADPRRPPLEPHELLLGRDVLDTQVVDLRGLRLSRVSEVILRRSAGGLDVVALDLGSAGLLRRVGLGRLARRRPVNPLAWAAVHLSSRRGHQVQLTTDAANFRRLDAHGLAELLTRLSTHDATDVIHAVDPAHAAAAIHRSHPRTGRRLVHALSLGERRRLAAAAATEHAETIVELSRHRSPIRRHRFLRTAGWRLNRPAER
ncbi:MAG: hypothetical protein NTX33_05295 [Propionibacteriales bacterium]|nr:hypothetical protein [Propionibacteriales bacterium]